MLIHCQTLKFKMRRCYLLELYSWLMEKHQLKMLCYMLIIQMKKEFTRKLRMLKDGQSDMAISAGGSKQIKMENIDFIHSDLHHTLTAHSHNMYTSQLKSQIKMNTILMISCLLMTLTCQRRIQTGNHAEVTVWYNLK